MNSKDIINPSQQYLDDLIITEEISPCCNTKPVIYELTSYIEIRCNTCKRLAEGGTLREASIRWERGLPGAINIPPHRHGLTQQQIDVAIDKQAAEEKPIKEKAPSQKLITITCYRDKYDVWFNQFRIAGIVVFEGAIDPVKENLMYAICNALDIPGKLARITELEQQLAAATCLLQKIYPNEIHTGAPRNDHIKTEMV